MQSHVKENSTDVLIIKPLELQPEAKNETSYFS